MGTARTSTGRARVVTRRTALFAGLGAATAACDGGLDNPPAELRIATGPPGAVYREVGGALAEVLDQRLRRTRVRSLPTDASVQNLRLLASGGAEFGIAQLDATSARSERAAAAEAVAAVARLFDSWLHLVVHADGPIRELADLHERTVAIGAPKSGTQFTVRRLLRLMPEVRPHLVHLNQAEEASAFRQGRVDAFFSLTGVPTPAVSGLARAVPIRLVPLSEQAGPMNERYGGKYGTYRSATIPSSAYPGVAATGTLTVANLLLARPELASELVAVVADTLFSRRAKIAQGHPEARSINVRTGIATGPVPLHPGAIRYYRTHKR